MKKLFKSVLCIFMAAAFSFATVGCKDKEDDSSGNNPPQTEQAEFLQVQSFDRDYVYSWYPKYVENKQSVVCTQAPSYAFRMRGDDSDFAVIDKFGQIEYDGNYFIEQNFSSLPSVQTSYSYTENGEEYVVAYRENIDGSTAFFRTVDSGRHVQRKDVTGLGFAADGQPVDFNEMQGRVEFLALKEYMSVQFELYSSENKSVDVNYYLELPDGYSIMESSADGSVVMIKSSGGAGYLFGLNEGVQAVLEGDRVKFTSPVQLKAQQLSGITVKMYAKARNISLADGEVFENEVSVTATGMSPEGMTANSRYDDVSGITHIDLVDGMVGSSWVQNSFADQTKRQTYERLNFTLTNDTDKDKTVVLSFEKNEYFSVYGVSPMIRDAETKEPIGEQVQVSKNWHTPANNYPLSHPTKKWTGCWLHAYVTLTVKAKTSKSYEYTCAYAEWGGVAPASHAQLSLVGWGGNTTWDQVALGTNGENICYSPQSSNSVICDVRPAHTMGALNNDGGEYLPYTWTGNIGGGDFMLADVSGTQMASNVNVYYHTQAPNLTDVTYRGITSSGNISFDYRLQLGRTNDVSRNIYTLTYEFEKDSEVSNLTLFSFNSDEYAKVNCFTKYAYGNDQKVIEDVTYTHSLTPYVGSQSAQAYAAEGNNPWFMLYSSDGVKYPEEKDGDNLLVVRSYQAEINGTAYTTAAYNIRQYVKDGVAQPCFEITLPADAPKQIKAGSKIQVCLEFITLPAISTHYYGEAEYMLQNLNAFSTPQMGVLMASGGVGASVGKGTLVRDTSFVSIEAKDDGAEFTLSGGRGMVAVEIKNLPSYSGWKLQSKRGGEWIDVDQSIHGNDFWQTKREADGKYSIIYNVEAGTSKTEYRLIKG